MMKSLSKELEKIEEFIENEEIINTKDTINLYSLNSIIKNEINSLSKYDSDFMNSALDKLKEDFKKYKYELFKNKRKGLKKLAPSGLYIVIKNNYDKRWDYDIALYFKTNLTNNAGYIRLRKKEGIEDINISFASDMDVTEREKNNIKRFIVNHYYDDIIKIFYGMEKITDYYRLLKEDELNKLQSRIPFTNSIFSQRFVNELFEVKFNTYINGINYIDISLSDNELKKVMEKDLLIDIEINQYMVLNLADILKRFNVNIKDLNPIYQNIVINSEYYKNLNNVKKLMKK